MQRLGFLGCYMCACIREDTRRVAPWTECEAICPVSLCLPAMCGPFVRCAGPECHDSPAQSHATGKNKGDNAI